MIAALPASPPPLAGPAHRVAAPRATFDVFQPSLRARTVLARTNLAILRGRVVVVTFTDDRCAGCAEAREAALPFAANAGNTVGFAVATGLPRPAARAMVRTRQGRSVQFLPTAADPDGALARAFAVPTLPATVVIDRAGRVAARFAQPPAQEDLQSTVDRLTREGIPADVDPPTRPHLSVFDVPAPAVPVPAHLRPTRAPCPYVPGSMRLIGTGGGSRFLAARSLDGGLLVASIGPEGAGIGCGAAAAPDVRARELRRIARRGIVAALGSSGGDRGPVYALLVLDGYTTATVNGTVFPIHRNGVVVTGVGKAEFVTLRGPAGGRHVRIFG